MKRRHAALAFILITVSLDMLALGIIVPVLPKLVLQFLHGDISKSALIFGAFGTIFAVMQLFCSPILGMLSDRYGRKPIVVLSNLGTSIDYLAWAIAPSLGWLFAVRVIMGMTTSSITTAFAYITDITPAEKRAGAMGMVSAAFGAGFIIGPAIGGILGNVNIHLPFYVCAAMSFANALYGYFVLPESLNPEDRQPRMAWERANPFGSLRMLRSHPELARLAAINFVEYIAHEVLPVIFTLYVMYRYSWNLAQVGWSLALVGASIAIVQMGVTGRVVTRLGERRTMILGLCFGVLSFAAIGGSANAIVALIGFALLALWGLAGPTSQSLMTHRVSRSEQGELQGALGGMRSIAMLIGPGLFSSLFAYSIATSHAWKLPGASWFLAAALLFVTVLLAVRVEDVRIKAGNPPTDTLATEPV